MKRTKAKPTNALRRRAEQRLRDQPPGAKPQTDVRALVHELQVHQVELEMQNEELAQAQAAAQAAAADRYAELFDFAPVGYFVLDNAGVIWKVNRAGAALLGLDGQRVIGQRFAEFVAVDWRPDYGAFWREVRQNRTKQSCELKLLESGQVHDVLVEGLLADDEGDKQRCRLAVVDITARKRAEEELRLSALELERSNRDLAQFAYAASHDLQEPLRAVSGFVQLLQRRAADKLDPKEREYIAQAVEGAARMDRLICDLLTYSRVDTQAAAFEPTDLNQPLNDALAIFSPRFKAARGTVTRDPLPTLVVDASQITRLLQNLISNALKFRGEPPPEVHIGSQKQAGGWVFSVRDNGLGIEPQYFERIFQIFQRLHTRREYPGTGIGLAVCKKIVERHGGKIWVESRPGEGSTFSFSLPDGVKAETSAPEVQSRARRATVG